MRKLVQDFLSRDDNSRILPGKNDVKKNPDGIMQPKRTLTDYLESSHQKFCMENSQIKISRATFCRYRPAHILTVSFALRRTCLCTKHQNMSLKLKALKQHTTLQHTNNVDTFFSKHTDNEIQNALNSIQETEIKYSTWKKVDIGEGKRRMKVVEEIKSKEDFIEMFKDECISVRYHIRLVRNQYKEIRNLKENLGRTEVVVQMDFAENYTCSNVSEIQSAYWNPVMVTLHPVVAYFRNPNDENEISHKSFVYVSDELGHTCSTVYAFLKDLVPRLKELIPELSCIHYLSDSPTSQYRNKSIFHTIANHLQLFGAKGSWQYFEAGHGKGPCDGVGAVAKRMADEAVRQGRVTIQDASDYFAWASGTQGAVKYVFVSKEQCEETQNAMKTLKLSPVKGTIKIHSVFGLNENKIACRNASCFCENCYKDGLFSGQCDGWEYHTIGVEQVQSNENGNVAVEDAVNSDEQEPVLNNVDLRLDDIVVDQYVAAIYDSNWFIGKVLDIDRDDGDVNISFMERLKTKGEQLELKYKWPNSSDELWVQFEDIVCVVNEPTPIGSSKRGYQISVDDLNNIKEKVSEKTL